ncbi:odorant receptor 63a-like [Anopheles albimanus]|uniref:odorant receptor 63a-like n=1 Tax=Anopheles albimanus TaxID=7167 RepID=UPI001641EDE9|nr:odorant receptor 63a-like [Anopheles albimanus]
MCFRTVYSHSPRLAHELTLHNRLVDRFTKAWTSFMVLVAIFYWIAPLPRIYWTYFTRTNASEPLELVQHLEIQFYWLDNRNSIRDYTIYAAMMLPFIFLCATMNNMKTLTVSCSVEYCTKFMCLVTEAIRQLDSLSANDDQARELRKVVAMHKRVLICSRLLDESLRPLLLMQWLLCIIIWSVTLVYFDYSGVHMKSISIIVMFLLVTAEMLSYCILGTRLTSQAEQLERVIYASRWYNLPIKEQRNVQIMLKRAQGRVGIRGYKFVNVNLEEFSRMVNRAYSAYVVLKREISA